MTMRPILFWPTIVALALVAISTPIRVSAQVQDECDGVPHCGPFDEDPGTPCLGPDDPFCDGEGGSGEFPSGCMNCEWRETAPGWGAGPVCTQVDLNETGRENCDQVYEGGTPVSCSIWGIFCENIVVFP